MVSTPFTYREAGVNISTADTFIEKIRPLIRKTERPGVLTGIGHFAGLFSLPTNRLKRPVLCAGTDGVGTKLRLALQTDRLEGLGQDLVAMNANDLLCVGGKPLFFLDYFATGRLDPDQGVRLMKGICRACREIDCAVLGGETAEMPSLYEGKDFDLAGFIVGIVDREKIVDGSGIRPGDKIIGLASSGPHSNGFSLIRKILTDRNLSLEAAYPPLNRPLGKVLMEPTRLYGPLVFPWIEEFSIAGIAHITGGGLHNISRILPADCQAVIERESWPRPPLFRLLQEWGNISDAEMETVFNIGIGLVLILPPRQADRLLARLKKQKEKGWMIGNIRKRATTQKKLIVR